MTFPSEHCPWVRVIVVNYNGGAFLQDCIDALAGQTMADFEAVIVDNASSDGSADAVRLPDARFRLLRNDSNAGFAAANNQGAADCRTRWIATLNPDTRAEPNWLEELKRGSEHYPDVGMFGSTLVMASHPNRVDGFGDVLSIAGIPWRGGTGLALSDLPQGDIEVFAPCAAAALYMRERFEAVGGFDEAFFCYVEDVDLGLRLRLIGDRCMQLRQSLVHHHGSDADGAVSDFKIYLSFRNRLWLLIKGMPLTLLAIALPMNVLCSLTLLTRGHLPVRTTLKGLWQGLAGSGAMWRSRSSVRRRLKTAELAAMLVWDLRKLSYRPVFPLSGSDQGEVAAPTVRVLN